MVAARGPEDNDEEEAAAGSAADEEGLAAAAAGAPVEQLLARARCKGTVVELFRAGKNTKKKIFPHLMQQSR